MGTDMVGQQGRGTLRLEDWGAPRWDRDSTGGLRGNRGQERTCRGPSLVLWGPGQKGKRWRSRRGRAEVKWGIGVG